MQEFAHLMQSPQGLAQVASDAGHLLPHIQRFNYLFSGSGLPANVFVGPWGSGVMGSLTKGLAGDPRGWAALKQLIRPSALRASWQNAGAEAADIIRRAESGDPLFRAELGGAALEKLPPAIRDRIQAPGRWMTRGDITIRNILKENGFGEDEARGITLTAEPYLASMQKLVNLRRGESSPLIEILAPFVKTPANIFEQGLVNMPGTGMITQAIRQRGGAEAMPLNEQVWRQIIGSIVGMASYAAGANMDPENARIVRRYITNAAGQYSLQAAIGFAAGQSVKQGNSPLGPRAVNEFAQAIPLPVAGPVGELANFAVGNRDQLPGGIIPGAFKDAASIYQTVTGTGGERITPKIRTINRTRQ